MGCESSPLFKERKMEPDSFNKVGEILIEVVDIDYPNYIEVMNLRVFKNCVGQPHIKIGNYYIDDYQLERILDKLKENK